MTETSCYVEEDDEDKEIPAWNDQPEGVSTIGDQLSDSQREELAQLIVSYGDVFSNKPGRTDLVEHRIETNNTSPIRLPPYRLPHAYRDAVQKELKEMSENGIIEPSTSGWAAPIVLIPKKDGSLRLCVDYRRPCPRFKPTQCPALTS